MSRTDLQSLESLRWSPKMDRTSSMVPDSQPEALGVLTIKLCVGCQEMLPVEFFYVCSTIKDGRQNRCKKCFNLAYRQGKKSSPEDDVGSDKSDQHALPDALYIIENPRIPGEVKIGRSQNPEERAKQLSAGNNFRLAVKHSYEEKGFLEKTLHQRLKRRRVEECAGVEWFRVSVEQADFLVRAAILEDELSRETVTEAEPQELP